ncbi:MAG: tol-pal system protein YbgF [Deltaproteobacteria bacterium]|nr:tol-pal system protein YbgF [Deltaproteobacteria bacterium]
MKPAFLMAFCVIFLFSGCAFQEDVNLLNNRLMSMENRMRAMDRRSIDLGKKQSGLETEMTDRNQVRVSAEQKIKNRSAAATASIDEIRVEISKLNGRLDKIEHIIKKEGTANRDTYRKYETLIQHLQASASAGEQRIAQLEHYLNLEKTRAPAEGETAEPVQQSLSEEQRYLQAKQKFDAGDFDAALEGFSALIKRYPKSKHADNAQFWIGEIYYREKWYEKAILEYQKVIEKYAKGNKVAAALLKQGFSFSKLKDKANARLLLQEVIKKHPKSKEAQIAQKKLKGL